MSWAHGTNAKGREIGYSVPATCDEPACHEQIDRGLAFVCGDEHDGGELGCGKYFCYEHLFMDGEHGQLCARCFAVVNKQAITADTTLKGKRA